MIIFPDSSISGIGLQLLHSTQKSIELLTDISDLVPVVLFPRPPSYATFSSKRPWIASTEIGKDGSGIVQTSESSVAFPPIEPATGAIAATISESSEPRR